MSSSWFHKLWRGAGAIWSWGLLALFLFSLWSVGSLVVHYFQGAGLNGVYEASDGAGEMTFWSDGTYLMSSVGIQLPGKYRLRNNGTVDMAAQFDALTHPAPSASPGDQGAHGFMGLLASGIGEGVISPDKNTFQWQGHVYSYDHRPTTGPPALPDPNAPETGGQKSGAASAYQPPTPQESKQSLTKPGDPYTVDTTPAPNITDPNQIGGPPDKDEWGPNSPKMQQYYATHPNKLKPQAAPPPTDPSTGAPMVEPSNTPQPPGVFIPNDDVENAIQRVNHSSSDPGVGQ